MWPSEAEIQHTLRVLTSEFGEDIAQHTMLRLARAVKNGKAMSDVEWFSWAYTVAYRTQAKVWKKERRTLLFDHTRPSKLTDKHLDSRDPARIAEAKEILQTMPVEFLADVPLSDEGEECLDDRVVLTKTERNQRWRARKAAKQQFDL